MIKVNYKSDFKINERSERVAVDVPFVFSYYVFGNRKYVASFDGKNYVNCERKDDGSLDVIFNSPDLGIGPLKVERKYAVDDMSFADGVFDIVSVEKTGVFLTSGQTFEDYIQILVVPPYLKGDKGEPMRWETMTEVERGELVEDVAEAIDPEMVMTENEQARIQAERERVAAENSRANVFGELKTEMEQTIEDGKTATEAAEKVVEEYDGKVAVQDEKLSELGSYVSDNPEYARAYTDAEGRFLWGIKQDGSIEWAKGVPQPIKDYIASVDLENDEEVERINQLVIGLLADVKVLTDTYHYVSNPEWACAIVDSEERILMGIKADGRYYIPNRDMYHVESNPEYAKAVVDSEGHVLFGIKADGSCYIPKGISEEAKKGLLELTARISWFETDENPEWLQVTTDSEGRVLEGIGVDGKKYFSKQEMLEKYNDVEGRTEMTLDADGKVVSYRDKEGVKHEHKLHTEDASFDNLRLNDANATQIEEALKKIGFTVKVPIDWSDKEFVEIPIPRTCAVMNIIAPKLGTAKGEDIEGFVEFWDNDGNYFKKPIILNAQGTSSMSWWKKNQGLDIDDGSKIKFGNWVAQDSFHIKKYYIDVFRGQCIVGYHVIESMYKDREYGNQRPWDYMNNNNNSTTNGIGEIRSDFETGALGHPDGFPVMLYLNGKLDGLYAWAIKKHRDNYWMKKNVDSHIILDGAIGAGKMFGQSASEIIWYSTSDPSHYGFEVRNPKTLVYQEYDSITKGYEYDGDVNKEIAGIDKNYVGSFSSGNTYSQNQIVDVTIGGKVHYFISTINGNTDTPTLSDNEDKSPNYKSSWINCTKSVKVKQSIQRLAESTIRLAETPTKEVFEQYFIVDQFIDYWIVSQVLYNWDGFDKNWIWCTWDGEKWCPTLYDADSIFGMSWNGIGMVTSNFNQLLGNDNSIPSYYLYSLYKEEIKVRYKELRDKNVISAETITSVLLSWLERCGYDNITTDIEECCAYNGVPQTPSYRDGSKTYELAPTTGGFYNSPMRVKNWLKDHIGYLDNVLNYV